MSHENKLELVGALFVQSVCADEGQLPKAYRQLVLDARKQLDTIEGLNNEQFELYREAGYVGFRPIAEDDAMTDFFSELAADGGA